MPKSILAPARPAYAELMSPSYLPAQSMAVSAQAWPLPAPAIATDMEVPAKAANTPLHRVMVFDMA